MNNLFMCIGRVVALEEHIDVDGGNNYIKVNVAINRNFKNKDGIYETDFINVNVYGGMGSKTLEFCNKGDLIALKGRMETTNEVLELIAEKVAFLSNNKEPMKVEEN